MLFEAFARNRLERPEGEAFLIPSGDRYFPVSWKRFTDDLKTFNKEKGRLQEEYAAARPRLTSLEFWREYLGLDD